MVDVAGSIRRQGDWLMVIIRPRQCRELRWHLPDLCYVVFIRESGFPAANHSGDSSGQSGPSGPFSVESIGWPSSG